MGGAHGLISGFHYEILIIFLDTHVIYVVYYRRREEITNAKRNS